MSEKLLLLNFLVPQKIPLGLSIIVKSNLIVKYFSATCGLSWGFVNKMINYVFRSEIQVL